MRRERVLIIGSNGQLGSVLTEALINKYGVDNVVASDLYLNKDYEGIFEFLDATEVKQIEKVIVKYKITHIFHLAAILSAKGEKQPLQAWDVNMQTWLNVLEASRIHHVKKVFFPSSIAVFGQGVDKNLTPQTSVLNPLTVYGISKVAGENWANYYYTKYGLDVRSLRFPGVIGYQSMPGGGTTDYAVEIYHKAVSGNSFTCFLNQDTTLPMIFIDDAIRAVIELMDAPKSKVRTRTSYNISGVSFSPSDIERSIQKTFPDFKVFYKPDFRQKIAENWPRSINDNVAERDWHWKPEYDLDLITATMIHKLGDKYKAKSFI